MEIFSRLVVQKNISDIFVYNVNIHYPKTLKRPFIDFANEIIINSQITVRKYKLFKCALNFDIFAFVLFLFISFM